MHKRWLAAFAVSVTLAAPLQAEPVVVAALGDSLTQGYGLPQGDGLVPQLQAWLDAQGVETRLINAGVSGDTTAGGLARIDWTLTPDVQALIVGLGGNDFLRGIDPALTRSNLDAILDRAEARGLPVLLIGLHSAGNYGPEYKAAFDAIFPDLAAAHGALLYPDFFEALTSDDGPGIDPELMQADGIHPNAKGVALVVQSLGPKVLELIDRVE
ncbi:arylesterase [Frigidibacter sp. SLM-1]|nr:arylesterase [Frigidibacter sp. ROC022]